MNYRVYKLAFSQGVHFGRNSLNHTQMAFAADTLFSALCQEAVHSGDDKLHRLVAYAKNGDLCLSDAFPYKDDLLFLPKPMIHIEGKEEDSSLKKQYKKLKYIPLNYLTEYLSGCFPIERAGAWSSFGIDEMKVSASIRGEEETKPYRVAVFRFFENCGLYIVVGYANEEARELFEELTELLSYSGIGGKRSSGLGRFDFLSMKMPEKLLKRLQQKGTRYMTLSAALPQESEMINALQGAEYLLEKRSGFVSSETYANEHQRKRDLYVLASGACFKNKFDGDVYDVSNGGSHPIYRYAKPMFLEVDS